MFDANNDDDVILISSIDYTIEVTVEMNDIPQDGTCEIYPSSGEISALTTIVTISCSDWVDDDTSLSYQSELDEVHIFICFYFLALPLSCCVQSVLLCDDLFCFIFI